MLSNHLLIILLSASVAEGKGGSSGSNHPKRFCNKPHIKCQSPGNQHPADVDRLPVRGQTVTVTWKRVLSQNPLYRRLRKLGCLLLMRRPLPNTTGARLSPPPGFLCPVSSTLAAGLPWWFPVKKPSRLFPGGRKERYPKK